MEQFAELQTAIDEQTTSINEMKERVAEDVAALQAKIEDLLGGGNEDVAHLLASIRSNTESVRLIDPVVAEPKIQESSAAEPAVAAAVDGLNDQVEHGESPSS